MMGFRSAAAPKLDRTGVLAVVQEQPMADRLQGLMHELQLDDELVISDTLDTALRRIRSGYLPRVMLLDLADGQPSVALARRQARPLDRAWASQQTETPSWTGLCSKRRRRRLLDLFIEVMHRPAEHDALQGDVQYFCILNRNS